MDATSSGRPLQVAVFCGSRPGRDPVHAALAKELGQAIGGRGWRLVYGGGHVGLMGIVAQAVLDGGGQVHGIITQHLVGREVAMPGLQKLDVVDTMFERKRLLIDGSDAYIVLPGGFGTVDELLDVLTLKQLDEHRKPIVLLDSTGRFWAPWLALARHLVDEGFAGPSALALAAEAADVEAALRLAEAAPGTAELA
ncbi:LOG family protein [Geminicoccus roseus]|uniref:LOG family protein n=1 Tax=Geminicoccus roseus TaxID=404900 RepID=UPI0003F6C0F8|nr:TIGR00730 family Rossman fold protein [Geminicoccus roseus]